jgi:DNA-directed RNA polymerase specialized sigma subunit
MSRTKLGSKEFEMLVRKVISLESIERKIIHLRICESLDFEKIEVATGMTRESIKQILSNVIGKILLRKDK